MEDILKGKKILIVDDEPDVLETLQEMLDMCLIDTAPDYETAKKFLAKYEYDVTILDIMGVRGYDLLDLSRDKGIPAIMLTAHALSPDNLVESIKRGAYSYVPKDKIADIATYVAEVLKARIAGEKKPAAWFERLRPFFDRKFGPDWKEKHKEFWKEFDKDYRVSRRDVEDIM